MRKILLFFAMLSICAISVAQVITPFTVRKTVTQKGGIVYLSNVSTKATPANSAQNDLPPGGTGTDNGFLNAYVDIDSDPLTWMSSSDQLNLPLCSDITWAGLYWGGDNSLGDENYATRNKVKLKPDNGSYIDITADELKDNTTGYKSYHCFKDITSILQANLLTSTYTVANVATDISGTSGLKNLFGGWTIVIIYKNSLQTMRNLTVFNGLSFVGGAGATVDIPISGFQTPLSGPVSFELGLVVYDGDRSYVGDQLLFKGATSFINVSDAIHPANDVFNSTLARNGVLTSLRNPSFNNTLGYDASVFVPNNTTKNYIGNNAISATIRQTTGGEYFITQVVTSAIDVYEPDLRAATRVKNITHPGNTTANRGDILEYSITGLNIGSDPAINTYIKDTIEGNAEYIPGTIKVVHGTNVGDKTDAAGDDEAEYIASSKVVKVRIGAGATSIKGGLVNNDPAGTDSTQFTFRVKATEDCVYLTCDNVIDNSSYIVGTGNVSGNTFDNASNPEVFSSFGCPLTGSTKTPILTTGCPVNSATATSPVCQGDNINFNISSSPSATYLWSGPNGFTSTLQNPTITNATIANTGTYTGHIYINKTTCDMTYSPTVVVTAALAGPDQIGATTCSLNNTTLAGNAISGGGTWSIQSGAGGSFSDTSDPTATFSGTTGVPYTLRWSANGGSCPSTFDEVNVKFNQSATTSVLSGSSSICYNGYANVKVTITGGVAPYTVVLNNGGGTFINYTSGSDIIVGPVTSSKTFNLVSVTDANGCTSAGLSGSAVITVSDAITGTGVITQLNPPVSGGGPKTAGTAGGITSPARPWLTPTNTTSSNGVYTSVALSSNTNSDYIYLSNFGFTVPGGTIAGVEVTIERFYTTTGTRAISSGRVTIGTVSGTTWSSIGTSQTLAAFPLSTKATQTIGGPTNLLGANTTTLTPAIVNGSTFGIRIRATSTGSSGTATANIDYVTVKIYYTPAASYCDDATSLGFSVTPYTNATTYTWSSITGGSVVTGQGTTSCTMDFNGAGQSGNYNVCVTASNNCQTLAPSCITVPVSDCVNSSLYIMGNVYWDKNAMTDNLVNGTGVGTANGSQLYATLMAGAGTTALQNSYAVTSSGTYKFLVSASTAYKVYLSTTSYTTGQTPVASLPAGCSNTGEIDNNVTNTTTGSDATADGMISVAGFTTNNNINVNFGIKISTPPVAVNDVTSTSEDTPVTFNVTTNDTDVDGTVTASTVDLDLLTAGVQNSFSNAFGSWSVNASGIVTYTPTANYNGNASITYKVNDNEGNTSNTGALFVAVSPVNDAPVAVNDAITTLEDTPVNINVTTNDYDVDGTIDVSTVDLDPATPGIQTTFTVVNQGTYTVNALGIVTFTPVLNFNGTATAINYKINDNTGATSAIATLTITVTSVIDPPIADNDSPSTDQNVPISFNVTTNDIGVDAPINVSTVDLDPLTGGIQTNYTVIGEGDYSVSNLGIVTFTPDAAFYGTTSPIDYVVNDNSGNTSNTAKITIAVTAANAPVANNDVMPDVNEGSFITFDVTANDVAAIGHTLNVSRIDLDPSTTGIQQSFDISGEGTFSVDMAGVVTFAPAWGFYGGPVTASYTIKDNLGLVSNVATISVTAIHVNQRPTTGDDFVTTNEDTPITINVTTNDADDNGINVATVDLNPSTAGRQTTYTVSGEGTYTVDNLGNVTFTPVLNFNGAATPIYYLINDNGVPLPVLTSDGDLPGMISVTVNSVNDAPVAVSDAKTAPSNANVVFSLTSNDTDVDGTIDPATVDLNPSFPGIQNSFTVVGEGTYTIDNTGVLTFTPLPAFVGPITATPVNYTINDNQGATSNTATITISLSDPSGPAAVNDDASMNEDAVPITIDILANDQNGSGTIDATTVDLDPITAGKQTSYPIAGKGTFSVNTLTGLVTFTPVANYYGIVAINYIVYDDNAIPLISNPATISVTINPVNDLPTGSNKTVTTNEDLDFGFGFTDFGYSDIDGDIMTLLQVATLPAKGTLYLDLNENGIVDIGESISALGTVSKADIDAGYLRYKPLINENGASYATFTFKVNDGTGYSAAANTITVNVTAVNDVPSVVIGSDQTICANTAQSVSNWATSLSSGPADEASQTLSFVVTNDNNTLFSVQPSVDATGKLTYTTAINQSGIANVTIYISDNGGTANGGEDMSSSQFFTITVNACNPSVILLLDNPTITEAAAGVATFTATLSYASLQTVTVNLEFSGTASGTDYTNSSSSITIPAGSLSGTITVTAINDLIYEGSTPETVVVDISSVTNGTESGTQQQTTSITDDEVAPTVTLSALPLTIAENAGASTLTATLSVKTTADVTVSLGYTGTATSGGTDYTAGSTTITILAGSLTGTATITAVNDDIYEGNETVIADITAVSGGSATESGTQQATVTITDDEVAPTVTLSALPLTIAENAGASTLTATLSVKTTADVTVSLGYTGTATGGGTDYTAGSTTITILAGNLTGTTTITSVNDDIYESNETVIADITAVSGGSATENGTQQSTVTITDDEAAPTVTLSALPLSIAENAGVSTLTATLSVKTTEDVTVTLGYTGTATGGGTDYTAGSTTINILAGNLTGTTTITSFNDAIYEGNETVITDITAVSGGSATESGTQQATVTITDDEAAPTLTLSALPLTIAENAGVSTLTATLSVKTTADVTVTLGYTGTATGGGTDYTVGSTTITILAGSLTGTTTITAVNDDIYEGNETVITDITAVSGGSATENGTQQATVTITDDEVAPTVTLSALPLTIAENAGVSTLTATLSVKTTANVTVTLGYTGTATGGGTDYTAGSTTITILAGNLTGTTTITAVNDVLVEGNETIIVDITGVTNATENGIQKETITISDDDAAGFALSKTNANTNESGTNDDFTVVLTAQPLSDVVISVTSGNLAEGTVGPATLTFTPAIWNIPQTATITGVDDAIADGPINYDVTMSVVDGSSEDNFDPLPIQTVTVNNADNDSPGITVSAISSHTTEASGKATFTIVLNTQPSANVTVDLTSSNLTEGTINPATITFTPADWNTPQIVTVTGVDDDVQDGDITYSIITATATSTDVKYSGLDANDVTVINDDNDVAGITVSPISGHTTEASGAATFTVVLTSQPTADVTIDLTSNNLAEGNVNLATITFTPTDWNTPQTITITGVDDDVQDGDITYSIIAAAATSSDVNYSGLDANDVTVINDDNDVAGITVSPISGHTTEASGTATFTIVLTSQPTADVTIGLTSSNLAEGSAGPANITFTAADWDIPQTITVTGADDYLVDGNIAYTIVISAATSADGNYHNLDPTDVSVTNDDNDVAGFILSKLTALTSETGTTDNFTVVLNAQPVSDVVINVTSGDLTEGTVSPATLTFTPANWNTPQTVTITGVDDVFADGSINYDVTLSITDALSDDNFDPLPDQTVEVTNIDDDSPGITVSAISKHTTEAGGTASFIVVLNTQPTTDVTIDLTSSDLTEGTVNPASVTFTSANWNVPQTIIVTGVADALVDGDISYSIVTAPAVSADLNYNGLNANDVSVINDDNLNNIPVAVPDTPIMNEDGSAFIDVLANDTGLGDGGIVVTITGAPAHGTAVVNVDKTITYTPDANYFGTDVITYQVCDINGDCSSATATVTINPVNDPPVINTSPLLSTMIEDGGPNTINISGNTTNVDGDMLTTSVTVNPKHGTVSVDGSGNIIYTPNANYSGVDTITYQVCDNGTPPLCASGLAIVTVNPVNDPPVINTSPISQTMNEDGGSATLDVPVNTTNGDGDILTTSVVKNPAHGTVSVDVTGKLIYTPNANFNGKDTITYQVCDNGAPPLCASGLAIVTVSPVNDPPGLVSTLITHTIPGDGGAKIIDLPGNIVNVDGDILTTSISISPKHGTASINGSGQLVYTPNSNFVGNDTITYQVCDDGTPALCVTGIVVITVTAPANHVPVLTDMAKTTVQNTALPFLVTDFKSNYTDADNDTLVKIQIVSLPQNGTLSLNGVELSQWKEISSVDLGKLVFVPATDFNGQTSFSWAAWDGHNYSSVANITITVTPQDVFIPEGFSPNGDGYNDYFIIKGADKYVVTLKIFNRWGNMVYENKHYQNDWDGVSNSGLLISKNLPDGTYFYIIDFNNGEKQKIGYITINR